MISQYKSINGLKGIACIFIVIYHYHCLFILDAGLIREFAPFYPYSQYIFEYSKNAVELFFMLSGFLTALHYHDATISFHEYFRRHYGKLIFSSLIVNLWAFVNSLLMAKNVSLVRLVLSILMINTGWLTSFQQTGLPVNSTMWYIDVLLLCYLLYYFIRKVSKNSRMYIILCVAMVILGWVCLEHTPKLPFLWNHDGRGYATFFLGCILAEFQVRASDSCKQIISWLWSGFIVAFFVFHMVIGFESVFGKFGTMKYVRYFEFIAAPGIILASVNLVPVKKFLSHKAFVFLGELSAAIYYVHNNVMEDYILLGVCGDSRFVFLLMIIIVVLCGILYQKLLLANMIKFSHYVGRKFKT